MFFSKISSQMDCNLLVVKISLEIEKVSLDSFFASIHGGPIPDIQHGFVNGPVDICLDSIDAVFWDELVIIWYMDIRSGETNGASNLLTLDHKSV